MGLALDWVLYKARSGRWGFKESCSLARSYRPIGCRREACWAWPGFEPTRRAKLVARAASGRAGLAAAGDLAGLRRWLEIWWGCGKVREMAGLRQGRRSGGAAVGAGKLLEERAAQIRKTGDPKATGYLCVMGDLNPQPAD